MRNALVAIDAARSDRLTVENINLGLIRFQEASLLTNADIVSVVHPDSFALPFSYYRAQKHFLAQDAIRELKSQLLPALKVRTVRALVTEEKSMDRHIDLILQAAVEDQSDVLVAGSTGKSALSYMLQGSFAEGLSLRSDKPVLVFSEGSARTKPGSKLQILVTLDPYDAPTAEVRRMIVDLAHALRASLLLLPLQNSSRWWQIGREVDGERLAVIRREFAADGMIANWVRFDAVTPEEAAAVADQEQVFLNILCAAPAALKKPLLTPSASGRLIVEMARPILVLKEPEERVPAQDKKIV